MWGANRADNQELRPRIATEWLDKKALSSLWLCLKFLGIIDGRIYCSSMWINRHDFRLEIIFCNLNSIINCSFVAFWEAVHWWQSSDSSYYGRVVKSRSPQMSFCFDSPLRGVICQSCSPAINALLQPERRKTCHRLKKTVCMRKNGNLAQLTQEKKTSEFLRRDLNAERSTWTPE